MLKSRYLLIGLSEDRLNAKRTTSGHAQEGGQKKVVRKGGQKTRERMIDLLVAHPSLTREGISAALGICPSAVQKHLARLKIDGRIRRIGPDKGGHWEVVSS